MTRKLSYDSIAVTCAVLMTVSAGAALAEQAVAGSEQPSEVVEKVIIRSIEETVPAASGLTVVRDAETGKLRAPTAEEWQVLATSFDPLNRSDAGLVERHYPDGHVSVVLDGRFQSMTLLRRDAVTGEIDPTCTDNAQTASLLLTGAIEADLDREGEQ